MEVCSLPHPDSQGYEMRVGGLLDSLPDFKNIRKTSHSKTSGAPLQYPAPQPTLTLGTVDMKRTHSERDALPKRSPATTPRLCPTINQKPLKAQASTNHVLRTDGPEFQAPPCNNNTSSKIADCEIFLGGSCNPTSWRRDIAIPILKHSGISFFNPQVACWYPELVAAEHEAKDLANFLFFVIDSETRGVATIVEVACLIAQGKNVILVLTGLPLPGHVICGEPITESEIQDLACAQRFLRYLSNRHEIRVFECIQTAVKTTATLIRKHGECQEGLEVGTGRAPEFNDDDEGVVQSSLSLPSTSSPVKAPLKLLPKSTLSTSFDVFLGGDSLMTDDVTSILTKHGLSSWSPDASSNGSSLLDDPRMERTTLLFFYLNRSSRGLETLILAAYYVGRSRNVVLCIENLDEDCVINGEILSKIAIKDYNRGRCYLRDAAQRNNVPIFCSLTEAVKAIVSKLSQEKPEGHCEQVEPREA